MKRKVLILSFWHWPGHEATGPNQSLTGMMSELSNTFDMSIIGIDRKPGGPRPQSAEAGWSEIAGGRVLRLRDKIGIHLQLRRTLLSTPHEVLLLNSVLDPRLTLGTLLLRRLGLIPKRPTILSPRGEFSPGALSIRGYKKRAYLRFLRILGLTRDIWFHGTGPDEARDIQKVGLPSRGVLVAENIARRFDLPAPAAPAEDNLAVRLIFLSRLSEKKNLHFAIAMLRDVKQPVVFDIFGPVTDATYARLCYAEAAQLPDHIQVNFCGEIPHATVPETIAAYDIFVLPTLGENFGHAIHEALMSGVPVLISDQTPWRNLEAEGVGWDLPLDEASAFSRAVEQFSRLTCEERTAGRLRAHAFAIEKWREGDAVRKTREMFERAMSEIVD